MENLNNELNLNHDATSIHISDVRYGLASATEVAAPAQSSLSSLTFSGQLSYFFGEYFLGVLIVFATTLMIFAVPSWVMKPEMAKAMIGSFLRRALDICGSLIGLVLTLPVWLVVPILIKLDSPGPVFYCQERVGQNRRRSDRRSIQKADVRDRRASDRRQNNVMGRPFTVIKFRTMVQDAEKKCGPVWATRNDPRVTGLGRFLRKTRIDEIPQFVNVLIGDMSLVGPRPERPAFVVDLASKVDNYSGRLEVKPGLTGLAQVENGYDSSVESVVRKVSYDLEYIRRQSFWFDLKILLKTVVVVITGKGAC